MRSWPWQSIEKHLLGYQVAETLKMTEKFLFTVKSFLNMKEILEIVEQKDLFMGHQLILMMEFDGEVLKVTVRYYNVTPKTKVIYNFQTYKPDHESKKVTL